MNYYEHHLGDYLRDTAHLSMLEDGAYRRLLDVYYVKELPLPPELRDVYRLVRAGSKPERDAVAVVLREFFIQGADGWRHKRCDAEIARFQDKQAKAKRSAEARWNAQRALSDGNANADANASDDGMRTHSEGNAPRARPQAPSTSNQSPDIPASAGISGADAGEATKAMRKAGLQDVNPSHPDLLRLLAAGVTAQELADCAAEAVATGKRAPFPWVLATVEGRRRDAASAPAVPAKRAAAPPLEPDWRREQRERVQKAAPYAAARRDKPQTPEVLDALPPTAR
ncbi:YdaU family protein [Variovorax sp.]|uniref:YdaU family protein n=1 Tax=Variovorax sp. TaxID=1871043 RepID=UPI003BAB8F11